MTYLSSSCSPPEQLPKAAFDRLKDIEWGRLRQTAEDGLAEFAWAIDREDVDVEFVGIGVVGSILTTEFEPAKSDFDIYLVTDSDCEQWPNFCRMLSDSTSAYQKRLQNAVPEHVASVDVLGVSEPDKIQSRLRNPSLLVEFDENRHLESARN